MALKSIAVYAMIIAATVAGAEILARAYDWTPNPLAFATGDSLGQRRYDHSPTGYGDLAPNQDGHWVIWSHRPYHVQTNSVGLRNAEEPSDTAFRILAVGDSQTFGPYLANDDTWPSWTENLLRRRYQRVDSVQVFNAGIAGYTLPDNLAYLRDKGVHFRPRLVIFAATERNLHFMRREISRHLQRPQSRIPSGLETAWQRVLRASALVDFAEQVKGRIKIALAEATINRGGDAVAPSPPTRADPPARTDPPARADPPPSQDAMVARYGEVFREIAALLKSHGIAFAVVLIPAVESIVSGEASEMAPVLENLTRDTGTPYLDLTPAFRAHPEPASSLYLSQHDPLSSGLTGNAHLSREGSAVVGRTVAQWLIDQGLVAR